jgi:hypothetical protein
MYDYLEGSSGRLDIWVIINSEGSGLAKQFALKRFNFLRHGVSTWLLSGTVINQPP